MSSAFSFLRPLGAVPAELGHVTFRVWAHEAERVAVELRGERWSLEPEGFGVWSATLPAAHGDAYRYVVGAADGLPDPASRWQPDGLRGPSAVVDPGTFTWTDGDWASVPGDELVIYELHVGTFTPEGTFDAAIEYFAGLAELGVTAIEVSSSRSSRAATVGATTGSTSPRRSRATAGPRPSPASSTRRIPQALRCSSTSSTTTSAPAAARRWRRSGPTHRQVLDVLGCDDQLR